MPGVLAEKALLDRDGVTVADVACRHAAGRGDAVEHRASAAIVFVRRGCFVRSGGGVTALLEPSVAFCVNAGEEQRYDHPHQGGDDCTAVGLDATTVAALCGGDERLPSGTLPTSPSVDLDHRLLLAAAHRGAPAEELTERAISLAADALEVAVPERLTSGCPTTADAHRRLADAVREQLAAVPNRSLRELSRDLAVSPHHVSRVFRSVTGQTISAHRMRLRARSALERLAGGEHNLARLAADAGFADQSHLCRVLRRELGRSPSALRQVLTPSFSRP